MEIPSKVFLIFFILIMLTACESCNISQVDTLGDDEKILVIGTAPTTTSIVEAAIPSLEELGYVIKIKTFDDYVLPNVALVEGSIDANIFQHEPYLTEYNRNNNLSLKMTNEIILSLLGFYSNKYKSIESLPQNARIGIYQDSSNQDRALRLMKELNIISLPEKVGLYSLLDILDNKNDFKFITMDIVQLVKVLDELDACFVAGLTLALGDVAPKYTLAIEGLTDEVKAYAVGLVVTDENRQADWVNDIVKAFQTEKTKQSIFEIFQDSCILVVD